MIKIVDIYRKGEMYYVVGVHLTVGGWGLLSEPAYAVRVGDEVELNKAISSTLNAWRAQIPIPENLKTVESPILRIAKAKSYPSFYKGTKLIGLRFEGDWVTFVPTRYLGPRRGYEGINKNFVVTTAYDLAKSCEEAFSRCE